MSDQFAALVEAHSLLRHPILRAAASGNLNTQAIGLLLREESYVSWHFPTLVASVFMRLPVRLEAARWVLATNLLDECGGVSPKKSHARLLDELCLALEVVSTQGDPARALPSTVDYVHRMFELVTAADYFGALCVFTYGSELLAIKEYEAIREACVRAGLSEATLDFLDTNIGADEGHFGSLASVVSGQPIDSEARKNAEGLLDSALRARLSFYDGVAVRCDASIRGQQ